MGKESKCRIDRRGIGRKLFALALFIGGIAGTISWCLGFVWFYRIWPKPHFASFTKWISQVIELSNPEAEQGFFEAYGRLLRQATWIAWYRIVQSTLALIPLGAGLWIAWAIDYPWTYMATSTFTTLALGTGSLVYRSYDNDHHAIDSQ
jgi:hypothetical protein